jgi:hypothetical protein
MTDISSAKLTVDQRDELSKIHSLMAALDLAILGDASLRMQDGGSPLCALADLVSERLQAFVDEIDPPDEAGAA